MSVPSTTAAASIENSLSRASERSSPPAIPINEAAKRIANRLRMRPMLSLLLVSKPALAYRAVSAAVNTTKAGTRLDPLPRPLGDLLRRARGAGLAAQGRRPLPDRKDRASGLVKDLRSPRRPCQLAHSRNRAPTGVVLLQPNRLEAYAITLIRRAGRPSTATSTTFRVRCRICCAMVNPLSSHRVRLCGTDHAHHSRVRHLLLRSVSHCRGAALAVIVRRRHLIGVYGFCNRSQGAPSPFHPLCV
jgi:hypothetical protein